MTFKLVATVDLKDEVNESTVYFQFPERLKFETNYLANQNSQ